MLIRDNTVKGIDAVVFYLGKMSAFNWYSIDTLARQVDRVIVVSDFPAPPEWFRASNLCDFYITPRQLSKFIGNFVGADLAEIAPYKLCDFKPLWPLIAANLMQTPVRPSLACDVDCIYGDLSPHLRHIAAPAAPAFVGNRGHIAGGNVAFYSALIPRFDAFFRDRWRVILRSPRHYAFDEFRYFNKFLANWQQDSTAPLRWVVDISAQAVDVNYWSCAAHDQYRRRICSISALPGFVRVKFDGDDSSSCPYVHLQKRLVRFDRDVALMSRCSAIFFNLRGDGSFAMSDSPEPAVCADSLQRSAWKLAMFRRRLTAKVRTEAIWRW
jgi:hypothetical protein